MNKRFLFYSLFFLGWIPPTHELGHYIIFKVLGVPARMGWFQAQTIFIESNHRFVAKYLDLINTSYHFLVMWVLPLFVFIFIFSRTIFDFKFSVIVKDMVNKDV